MWIVNFLHKNNFKHYELSNFSLEGFASYHNSNYWQQKPSYIGIGPSAHSFNKNMRRWNVANNSIYIKISKKDTFFEQEELNKIDIYNEHIMLGLEQKMVWI